MKLLASLLQLAVIDKKRVGCNYLKKEISMNIVDIQFGAISYSIMTKNSEFSFDSEFTPHKNHIQSTKSIYNLHLQ